VKVALGLVGAVVGFVVGVLFTEVIFANDQSWPDVVPFALAVLGVVAGVAAANRLAKRNTAA